MSGTPGGSSRGLFRDADSLNDVADGIDEDRNRGRQDTDQDASYPRSAPLGGCPRQLELRVAIDELVAADQGRQVAPVGDLGMSPIGSVVGGSPGGVISLHDTIVLGAFGSILAFVPVAVSPLRRRR